MNQTGEWGQTLDPMVCGFGYNESVGQDYFPLTADEATAAGYKWSHETEARAASYAEHRGATELLSVDASDADILSQTRHCTVSGAPFRVNEAELAFYRKVGIPLPERCPLERHRERVSRINHFQMYPATSAHSGLDIWTVFAPDSGYTVYSEDEWLNWSR